MKHVIRFSRYRFVMLGLSTAVIVTGVVLFATRGLNLGIDFRGGLTQQIQIAPVAVRLAATGDAKVEASSYSGEREILGGEAIGFTVIRGAESQSYRFGYAEHATLGELAEVVRSVPGVSATVVADSSLPSSRLYPVDFTVDITQASLALNYALESGDELFATTENMRGALAPLGQFDLQTLGAARGSAVHPQDGRARGERC